MLLVKSILNLSHQQKYFICLILTERFISLINLHLYSVKREIKYHRPHSAAYYSSSKKLIEKKNNKTLLTDSSRKT